ncbi:MAG: BolA family transcriptional regulator [Deltaproteobacteria bacterium]|nr:BolA family transcriptional regulator [Deltaproteobacteria bacterium]
MNANDIKSILTSVFNPSQIEVVDDSGRHKRHKEAKTHGGGHYSVRIVSEMFAGKTLIERHQMIYQALVMPRPEIHALSIVARIEKEI